ncbi:MAG: hypothetical protein HYW56_02320, partial [Candidatus Harrisonbacteria bacterium]|nr:hypothetical protein [Candidatus Harrisonbacteria bacterium]
MRYLSDRNNGTDESAGIAIDLHPEIIWIDADDHNELLPPASTAAANIITLTANATRALLARAISVAEKFSATILSQDEARRAFLTSEDVGRYRVTTLKASLHDLIAPQLTVGEIDFPELRMPDYSGEPVAAPRAGFFVRPEPAYRARETSTAVDDAATPLSFLDRLRERIVQVLVAREQVAPTVAVPQPEPILEIAIPQTVLPKYVPTQPFITEQTLKPAIPAPAQPAPREVVMVERQPIAQDTRLPVAANMTTQLARMAEALDALAYQRSVDRSELLKIISDTSNINRLPSVTLSAPTITGTVSGLTDDSIPNDITVGSTKNITTTGTFSSSATSGTSTITANLAAGTTTVSGVIRVNGTGATSTFAANVDVSGNLSVGNLCINCGGGGGFDGGTTTVTNLAVTNTSTSTFAGGLTVQTNKLVVAQVTGNVGVGTTTPVEQLAVAGRLYVGGSGTSTIENNLQVLGQLKIGTSSAYITDTQITGTSN